MNRAVYNLAISIVTVLFKVFFWVNPKFRKRKEGLASQKIKASAQKRIWFHCSSAGEYEQIAAVIDGLSAKFPKNEVLITFFSPSGMEWMNSKNILWDHAYLPFDGSQKIKKFIEKVNPLFLVIAKNELWFNLINQLHQMQIPSFLVSASINPNFFALKSTFFSKHLSYFQGIYTQDKESSSLFSKFNHNTCHTGDTRISRIFDQTKTTQTPYKNFFQVSRPTVIYGSVHHEDAGVLTTIKKFPNFNHVIVPHDISSRSITKFTDLLGVNTTLSSSDSPTENNYILVDKMGILAQLYSQSSYTYIGGGFGQGIHNIIEPLVHNNIVFVGPNHKTFHEANHLVKLGVVEVIDNPLDFSESLLNIVNLPPQEIQEKHDIAQQFIALHQHAAATVIEKIADYFNED